MGRYIEDGFTDTNGVLLTAHTIPTKRGSQVWAYTDSFGGGGGGASTVTIQSNQCQLANSQSSIYVDPGVTDCTIEFNLVISSTSGHRLAIPIRWTDISNHYYLNLREPQDDWTIYKVSAGVSSVVATGSKTFNTSTTYAVKIVISGTSVHVYIDAVSLSGAQTMDAHLSSTKFGIGVATITTPVTIDTYSINNGVTNAVASASTIRHDVDHALTFTGFVAAPTAITYNGVTEAFTGSVTTSAGSMLAIPLTDFAPASAHVATRWKTNYALVVSDGIDSASVNVQVDPMPTASEYEDWSTKNAIDWYGPTVPGTWQNGDEIYGYYLTGYGNVEAGTGWFSPDPLGLPAQGRLMCYDISAGEWLAAVDTEVFSAPSSGVRRFNRTYIAVSVGV